MVATKLSEVVTKGYEWACGEPGSLPSSSASSRSLQTNAAGSTSESTAWSLAANSLSQAADHAYSTLAGAFSSYYTPMSQSASTSTLTTNASSPSISAENGGGGGIRPGTPRAATSLLTLNAPWSLHTLNPYQGVRGLRFANHNRSSMAAVRSLLPLVTETNHHVMDENDVDHLYEIEEEEEHELMLHDLTDVDDSEGRLSVSEMQPEFPQQQQSSSPALHQQQIPPPLIPTGQKFKRRCSSDGDVRAVSNSRMVLLSKQRRAEQRHQNSETASQLAEGTLRALRDIALDEAVEFHAALRFWSERWEQPLLSWLEAGPFVWWWGYNHQLVGQKVAQLQAILARRCAAVGELQQHLLRAGWQRGVAQWGVLGHGTQWSTVKGTFRVDETAEVANRASQSQLQLHDILPSSRHPDSRRQSLQAPIPPDKVRYAASDNNLISVPRPSPRIGGDDPVTKRRRNPPQSTSSGGSSSDKRSDRIKRNKTGYYASVFVRNERDGKIVMDDAALAEWSVDAMELIRAILRRASRGKVPLPYESNWETTGVSRQNSMETTVSAQAKTLQDAAEGDATEQGELIIEATPHPENEMDHRRLPRWARVVTKRNDLANSEEMVEEAAEGLDVPEEVVISNLPLMAAEVADLLNAIEFIMPTYNQRRLDVLRPPSMFRRRWYITAVTAPLVLYVGQRLTTKRTWMTVIRMTGVKISTFFRERVFEPLSAIIDELWKGREPIADGKARAEVIAGLKEMIRSWLDENHPEMPVKARRKIAEAMDISLIERKKAESLKSLLAINEAIRLSFIEMQFIKKEMVNALYAMDEVMAANDINTNLAAVTPAVLAVYTAKQVFRFFYYALLKLGKSKEETYASFRNILTDIERLLVMRDNPPTTAFARPREQEHDDVGSIAPNKPTHNVLSADDLGMLMLLIHECRTILWNDQHRFSAGVIQSVSEDLAELAGERGAVSVQQQLQIIGRMCRTYPFLKTSSSGGRFISS